MFNEKAAQWAHDLVMKMDPAAAEVLVPMVMSDLFYQDIHNNKRVVNALVANIHKNMLSAGETLVSKGMVSNAEMESAIAFGLQNLLVEDETEFEIAKYDKQWGLRDADGSFSSRDELGSGRQSRTHTKAYRAQVKNRRERFKEYSTDYVGQNRGGMDLAAALDSRKGKPENPIRRGGMEAFETQTPEFARQWHDAANSGSSNAQTYRRLQGTGQIMGAVGAATGNNQLALAGAMGNFAGQYGPEAEKVVGPAVRRAAYRYRGVERALDPELISGIKTNVAANQTALRQPQGRDGKALSSRAQDQYGELKRSVTRGAVLTYMTSRVPEQRLAEIQRKSGRVTPSEGVIISADGSVHNQSFGHADDHYLPFNLKNLGKLKGGEYVRTRTSGGITSEDVYAGLMSGAKRVTVVSNSGTFSVEFAPDIAGIKRYGDKAQSMVGRYQRTLDTIRNGKLERVGVTPEVKAEILDKVEDEFPANIFTREEIQGEYEARVNDYKNSGQLADVEMDQIDAFARAQTNSEQDYKRARVTMIEDAREQKMQRLHRLDGDGYSTALEAMQEQYPYFIQKVTYKSRTKARNEDGDTIDTRRPAESEVKQRENAAYNASEGRKFSRGEDAGYVKPKHNRPEDVLSGYFDPSIEGAAPPGSGDIINPSTGGASGKIAGDRTDYQNWGQNPLNPASGAQVNRDGDGRATEAEAPKKPTTVSASERERLGAQRAVQNNADALAAVRGAVDKITPEVLGTEASNFPLLAAIPQVGQQRDVMLNNIVASMEGRKRLADELQALSRKFDGDGAKLLDSAATNLRGTVPPEAGYGGKAFGGKGFHDGDPEDAVKFARDDAKAMTNELGQVFGHSAQGAANAQKFVADVAAGKDVGVELPMTYGLSDAQHQALSALAAKSPEKITRSGEGYARLKYLDHLHGGEGSPKARAASASAASPASSSTPTPGASSSSEPHVVSDAAAGPATFDEVYGELDKMVGQEGIKKEVRRMADYLEVQRQRKEVGLPSDESIGSHMVFLGNPGTGKTSVAKLIGKLYNAAGVLPTQKVVEVNRSSLVGTHVGQTAPLVDAAVDAAEGGVLFIDEAYSLVDDNYGKEAIEQLLLRMENDRGKFVVIAAGYPNEMQDFLNANPGLRSRFAENINFEDYTPKELGQILGGFASQDGYLLPEETQQAMVHDLQIMHRDKDENFANGRTVRNYWEQAKKNQASRVVNADREGMDDDDLMHLLSAVTTDDLDKVTEKKPVKKSLVLTPVR